MIVNQLSELEIVGVYDRGVPNKERIVVVVEETVNLGQYGLMIGVRAANGLALPIRDNLFWFGDGIVNKGEWLVIYSGPGKPMVTEMPDSTDKVYSIHWGRENTMLANPLLMPILFRADAVQVLTDPVDLPQLHEEPTVHPGNSSDFVSPENGENDHAQINDTK